MITETTSLLTDTLFTELVTAASAAPSSDNMQPWEFRRHGDTVEVFCVKERLLSIDVMDMFTWISIGAAMQNLVTAAAARGIGSDTEYLYSGQMSAPAAVVRFSPGKPNDELSKMIPKRRTNRKPFQAVPLEQEVTSRLMKSVDPFDVDAFSTNNPAHLQKMASIDIAFSSILLEHVPFFDGLFDAIQFSRRELERERLGMDLKSLEVPVLGFAIARLLKRWKISRIVGRLGIGRAVAKILSSRLETAGALFLVTVSRRDPSAYMEAGRAAEQLWLEATRLGLSVHPYGVIPQYLTMADLTPVIFQQKHLAVIDANRDSFNSIFPDGRFPAIMFRVGYAGKISPPNDIRLQTHQIVRL